MMYQKTFSNIIETNETSKPENPQLEIKNPLHIPIYINALDLLPDPEFSYKGNIEVYNNNRLIFSSINNSLKNFSLFTIPLTDELLENNTKIKIFIWNSKDSLTIGLTVNSTVGETNIFLGSGSKPLDKELFNTVESTIDDIFPLRFYSDEIIDKSIYMAGYDKLIILISASKIKSPIIISTNFKDSNLMIDNNLNTKAYFRMSGTENSQSQTTVMDFGSIKKRNIDVKFNNTKIGNGTSPVSTTTEILISTDNINYISTNSETPMRYAKVITTATFGIPKDKDTSTTYINFNLYEIYDANIFGGTAKLSFLIRDINGTLIEYIDAEKFKTITSGGSLKLNIDRILPQLKNDLIIRLTVVNNIDVGVRLIKIK